MRRTAIIAGTVLVVLVAGGIAAYFRSRPSPVTQVRDPAVILAMALGALDRSPDPSVRLSPEQIERMLPYLRVLRDTDPSDVEASRALVEHTRGLLTQAQLETIRSVRAETRAQNRPQQGASPGVERPQGALGPGRNVGDQAALRRQILSRLIERLQNELTQPSP